MIAFKPYSLQQKLFFCMSIAFFMVITRFVLFDHNFFNLVSFPDHDLLDDLPFFATNMHSMRLFHEVAWYNPYGSAQYYQSFLSPLAPTPNHIVFILWSQLIVVLNLIGIRLPEYYQYLVINYFVLPFLAFFTFSLMVHLFFKSRVSVFFVLVVYALSGIGLWDSAWFYFQEPFTLFFVIASFVLLVQKPTSNRLLVLIAALTIQVGAVNYWTVYNSWIYVILFGVFLVYMPRKWLMLYLQKIKLIIFGANKKIFFALFYLFIIYVVLTLTSIVSMVHEQGHAYVRSSISANTYTKSEAAARIPELRRITTELFNPSVERALANYPLVDPPMHDARYIGVSLILFLLFLPFFCWKRRERYLFTTMFCVLIVCLGSPFILDFWAVSPYMNRIQHTLYFYGQYWQILVLLLATSVLDRILTERLSEKMQRLVKAITGFFIGLLLLVFAYFLMTTDRYPNLSIPLQANLYSITLCLILSCVFYQFILNYYNKKSKRFFVFVLLIITFTDLSRYFVSVSLPDQAFSSKIIYSIDEFNAGKGQLKKVWNIPNSDVPVNNFNGNIFLNLPMSTFFWPTESFLLSINQINYNKAPVGAKFAIGDVPFILYPHTKVQYQFIKWSYNDFEISLNASKSGVLVINQPYDRVWKIKVNGVSVIPSQYSFIYMSIPVVAGHSVIVMSYQPLARLLYWPTSYLLEIILLIILASLVRDVRINKASKGFI